MLTIEKLAAYGADTKTGLERCMGQEAFYIRLAGMILQEKTSTSSNRRSLPAISKEPSPLPMHSKA